MGDKGYISQKLLEKLFFDGIQLVTKLKSNVNESLRQSVLSKRVIIETINDKLKNIAQIVHLRHRAFHNFVVNLLSGIAAYCFFQRSRLSTTFSRLIDSLLYSKRISRTHITARSCSSASGWPKPRMPFPTPEVISYRFNASGKAYKGKHASEEDLKDCSRHVNIQSVHSLYISDRVCYPRINSEQVKSRFAGQGLIIQAFYKLNQLPYQAHLRIQVP